jgi:hypothetical protein
VLDALRDPVNGYYDPRDIMTTAAPIEHSDQILRSRAMSSGKPRSLKGVRIGIIRESMLTFPGVKADEPIVEAANKEIKCSASSSGQSGRVRRSGLEARYRAFTNSATRSE